MTPDDITAVNVAQPNFVGFVFAPGRHQIDPQTARHLKSLLQSSIKTVGVFVEESVTDILEIYKSGSIDIAQLHRPSTGTEIKQLQRAGLKVIQVFEQRPIDSQSPADYLMADSGKGSGRLLSLNDVPHLKRPFILAGGLNPDNVQQAIKTVQPTIVDVSSGVETNQKKDVQKIIQFIKHAKEETYNENFIK